MNGLAHELEFALSSLQKVPNFVLAVITTLGVSLGALMCLSILGKLLYFTPLPYPDQDRLHLIKGTLKNNGNRVMTNVNSFAGARELKGMENTFDEAAILAYREQQLENHSQLPLVTTSYVTPEFFSMLDLPMEMGRGLVTTESLGSDNPVAVLSYQAWQTYFQGRPDILNETINVGERSFKVVGVVSDRFDEPTFYNQTFNGSDIWLPLDFLLNDQQAENDWGAINPNITVIAKIRADITPNKVEKMVSKNLNQAFTQNLVYPEGQQLPFSLTVELSSFEQIILGDSQRTILLLLAGALTLLLIAISNVMNLMLSRTVEKQKQLTIKAILGANRTHLFTSLLAENLILMLGVTLLSLAVTYIGFGILRDLAAGYLPRLGEMQLSGMFIMVTSIIALVMAMIFSILSSRIVSYSKLQASIQSSGKGSGLQVSPRIRMLLISSQIALIGVLIAANMNVLKSSMDIILKSPGYELKDLSYLSLNYYGDELSEAKRDQLTLDIRAALERLPNIESVSSASAEPSRASNGGTVLRFADDKDPTNAMFNFVSENLFEVLEQPLFSGRIFTPAEVRDRAKIAVITKALADKLYPAGDALNKQLIISMGNEPRTIIGIVDNLVLPPSAEEILGGAQMAKQTVYIPALSVTSSEQFKYVIRFKNNQDVGAGGLLQAISGTEPNMRLWLLETAEQRHNALIKHELTVTQITLGLTLLSMLLAGVGIYGVLNYSTQLRRYELGARMSLGAGPGEIVKLVFMSNAKPIGIGFIASVIIGAVSFGFARQHIEGAFQFELISLMGSVVIILSIAAISSYLPLHSVIRKWPIHSIRS